MDFLDPHKKRAHRIRLLVGYVLLAIAIALATLIMVLRVQGFGIDSKTGDVIQNGLLFVDAHPQSAEIYINGERRGSTGGRFTLPDGDYTVELKREGYRDWQRSFTLGGGKIIRLVYPFLLPVELEPQDMQLYAAAPPLATQSPDRRWLLLQPSVNVNRLELIDLSSRNAVTTTLTLPSNLLTPAGAARKLELVEWSTDNRHVLLKHTFGTRAEFVIVDKNRPAESINLNNHFNRQIDQVALLDKKFDQYYMVNNQSGELVSAVLRNKEITQLAARNVQAFKSHGSDMIMYVTTEGTTNDKAIVKLRDKDETYQLRELPRGSKYLLDLAQYDSKWYVVAGTSEDERVYIYQDPLEDLSRTQARVPFPFSLLRLNDPIEYLSFSNNARFISIQSGSFLNVYDAEEFQSYRYDSGLKLAKGQKISWMDGHRFSVVSEGSLRMFDFDGLNEQTIVDAHPRYIPFFDRDYEVLYTLSPSPTAAGRTSLLRTPIVVD